MVLSVHARYTPLWHCPPSNGLIVFSPIFISDASPTLIWTCHKTRPLAIGPGTREPGWLHVCSWICSRCISKPLCSSTDLKGIRWSVLFFWVWSRFLFVWLIAPKQRDPVFLTFARSLPLQWSRGGQSPLWPLKWRRFYRRKIVHGCQRILTIATLLHAITRLQDIQRQVYCCGSIRQIFVTGNQGNWTFLRLFQWFSYRTNWDKCVQTCFHFGPNESTLLSGWVYAAGKFGMRVDIGVEWLCSEFHINGCSLG